MNHEQKYAEAIPRRFTWLVVCFVLVLAALITLVLAGLLTGRVFALLCLAAMIGCAAICSQFLKTAFPTSDRSDRKAALNRRKRSYILVGGMLWLVVATWLTRGGPLVPRLVGAAVVLLLVVPMAVGKRTK